MSSVADRERIGHQGVMVSQSLTSDGWKADGPLAIIVLIGAAGIAASFGVHGWARLGLQVLGALLMLPLFVLVVLTTLGGALAGLLNGKPSARERLALIALSVGLGAWLGSYVPGAPQELFVVPAGFVGAGCLLSGGRVAQPGTRRRVAGCIVVVAAVAGATGLWLLAAV
jgi:hypothetical protein